jgi:hypothetical protein
MKHEVHKTARLVREGELNLHSELSGLLNTIGIQAFLCCRQEDGQDELHFEFRRSEHVEYFLHFAQWPYKVELETWDESEAIDDGLHICVRMLVFFPRSDMPKLVRRCRELIAAQKPTARPSIGRP